MVRLFTGTVRNMTALVIYNTAISCHSISSKNLKKTVAKSGSWETMCDWYMQLFSMDFIDIEGTINRSRCLEAYLNMGMQ